jgi:(1->4)-alpha-D-glucan 1-alpha-D-glucosylmutase
LKKSNKRLMMKLPVSTYRIQLHDHFTFKDLAAILDYLHDLGITTVYASPVTTAFKGSQHGYDVADPLRLNPEIGTEEDWTALAVRLKDYGMTWLQDIVPNHMVYALENPWLYDVLERGKASDYYSFFDIGPNPVELPGDKLMAPFLGKMLTECLQQGELTLQYTDRGFMIRYFDNEYPVAAGLYDWICTVTEGCPAVLADALEEMRPAATATAEEWNAAKAKWMRQVATDPVNSSFIDRRIHFINERLTLIKSLLEGQHYILTHYSLASAVINYRRFFTVNSLICLRMEDEAVFDAYHRQIHRWYSMGLIQGLRIDHIDGLAAPKQYIDRLRRLFGPDCYMIAEKILGAHESMPDDWALEGMTGYEFLRLAGQVLTDTAGSRQLLDFYTREIIRLPVYDELVTEKKSHFLRTYMGGELSNLLTLLTGSSLLNAASQLTGSSLPGTASQPPRRLKEALAVLMASFPVYRIYPDEKPLPAAARKVVAQAFASARKQQPDYGPELLFLEGLFAEAPAAQDGAKEKDRQRVAFIMRFMQFTGPLAAKGIEDTTFYVYNPYIAHNEVGDSPATAGMSPDEFHRQMQARKATLPYALNATTTHDTKRGEDSRIRLNELSAQPQEFIDAVTRWRQLNRSLVTWTNGRPAPSANDEYLIYQALVGGFPADLIVTDDFRERFAGYLTKALREAKTETNYDTPDEEYEGHCRSFAAVLLAPGSAFLESFIPFVSAIIRASYAYSLSQLLIKLTAPGIPDIYQGAELWETSFVDPDNRRPVDFALRSGLLQEIKAAAAKGAAVVLGFVLDHPEKATMKMYTLYRTLAFRNAHPVLFTEGEYIPVAANGPLLAYIRRWQDDWALVLAPLITSDDDPPTTFLLTLPPDAPDTWVDAFTGDTHHSSEGTLEWCGWDRFPVALLTGHA